jgi:transposase
VNDGRTAHSFVASLEASSADPEVPAKPQRRRFSGEDKKRILEEADAATGRGAIGALLRREGIYSSTLYGWRKERNAAVRQAFSQKRGPQPKRNPLAGENEKLRRQNQRLREELDKAHIIIDVQKKVARLLGQPVTETPSEDQ